MKTLISILFIILIGAVGIADAADRLKLDDTSIVGTQELPKVLYIVPWKSTRLGALSSGAENGTFEGAMVPLDRHIYQREVEYYGMLQGDVGSAAK